MVKVLGIEVDEGWLPSNPRVGPPFPQSMHIFWPWVKAPPEEEVPPVAPPLPPSPPAGQYRLSVSAVGKGEVTPQTGDYPAGAVVTLTARPNPGVAFDHWVGDVSGTDTMVNIIMDGNKTALAYFKALPPAEEPPPYEPPQYVPPPAPVPPTPPPTPTPAVELKLDGISILSVNGVPIIETGVRPYFYWVEEGAKERLMIPYIKLAKPIMSGLGQGIVVSYRNDSLVYPVRGLQWFVNYDWLYDWLDPVLFQSWTGSHGWVGSAYLPAIGEVDDIEIIGSNIVGYTARPYSSRVVGVQAMTSDRNYQQMFAIVDIG